MKGEKCITGLWAVLLAFLIGLSSVACIVTGFSMAVNLGIVALWCGVAAVVSGVCFLLPLRPIPLCAASVTGVVLWVVSDLERSIRALLYRITHHYNSVHGWGVLRMEHYTLATIEDKLTMGLCVLAVFIVIGVAWAILCRRSAFPGLLGSLMCLGICLVTTETVPEGVWLYLWLLGVLLVMLTHTVRREDERRGNRLCAMALLPLALLLLLLFTVAPQHSYTGDVTAQKILDVVLENDLVQAVFGDFTDAGNTGSSVNSGTVQLKSVGPRGQSATEMFQVHTDFSGTLYLRGRALDAYNGVTWTDSGENASRLYWPGASLESRGEVTVQTKYAHRMLYLPYYVQSMDLSDVTRGVENSKKLTKYSFTTGSQPAEDALATLESATEEDFSPYLHLEENVRKWAEPLAQKITGEAQSVYSRAEAIAAYVRSSASYDLDTAAMPSRKKDFVKWFLEESDTGYCVHFASSAVVLLQAAGIPARYVSGYMVRVGRDCYTAVRGLNAHAWAEYWLPGFGWTVLEATPAAQAEPEEQPTLTPENTETAFDWQMLGIVSGVALLVALLAVLIQWPVRLHLRRRRLQTGSIRQRILAYWQEAVLFARCLGGLPDERLYAIAERAKFGRNMPTEQDLEPFIRYLADARVQLKRHSIFRKIYYRLVLALY